MIQIDYDLCCSSGVCAYMEPQLFAQSDEGFPLVIAKEDTGSESSAIALEEIAELCPGGAITITGLRKN